MRSFPVPVDDAARLRVLDGLKATAVASDAFTTSVTRAAAAIVGTPMSAITLVGRHDLLLRSPCGLPPGEVPRDVGFCSYTVMGCEPFIVTDLRRDERFMKNPLVIESPYARFYAGFPLVVSGQPVGALCVLDDRPRALDFEQIERLTQLARGTAAWLALQRARAA